MFFDGYTSCKFVNKLSSSLNYLIYTNEVVLVPELSFISLNFRCHFHNSLTISKSGEIILIYLLFLFLHYSSNYYSTNNES